MKKIALIRMPKCAGTSLMDTLSKLHDIDFNKFDKGHLFPYKNNIKSVKSHKKIICLRYPKEIKPAIQKGMDNFIHNPNTLDNLGCVAHNFNIEIWGKNKLNKDIDEFFESFYRGWLKNVDEDSLIVTYDELINNPKKIINRIEEFLELPKSKKVVLAKRRYTKSKIMKFFRLIYAYLRSVPLLRRIRRKISRRKPILYVSPKIKR